MLLAIATLVLLASVLGAFYAGSLAAEQPADGPRNAGGVAPCDLSPAQLAGELLERAADPGVAFVQVEPRLSASRVRVCRGRELVDVDLALDRGSHAAVVARVERLAGLDLAPRGVARTGRVSLDLDGGLVELQVTVAPTPQGERLLVQRVGALAPSAAWVA